MELGLSMRLMQRCPQLAHQSEHWPKQARPDFGGLGDSNSRGANGSGGGSGAMFLGGGGDGPRLGTAWRQRRVRLTFRSSLVAPATGTTCWCASCCALPRNSSLRGAGGGGTAVGHSTASSNQAVWSPPINSPPLEWSPMGLLCTSIKILTHTGNTHERGGVAHW